MGKLAQFAMIGVSRLRKLALRANSARQGTARLSTTVSLVGRLVDILAPLGSFDTLSPNDAPRIEAVADQIWKLQQKLRARHGGQAIQPLEPRPTGH